MSTFSQMKVSTKLSLGFGSLVVLMLLTGLLTWQSLTAINGRLNDVVNDKVPKLEAIASINYNVLDIARGLRNALLEIDDSAKAEAQIRNVLDARGRIKETVEQLEPKLVLPEGKAIMKRILEARTGYIEGQEALIRLVREKKVEEAKDYLLTEMRKRQRAYADATGELQKLQKRLLDESSQAAQAEASRSIMVVVAGIIISILLAALIAWLIVRDLMNRLGGEPAYAADNVQSIANGDISRQITIRPGDTTSLTAYLSVMQGNLASLVTEIKVMVAAAGRGDFSQRMDLTGKQGFGREIGESLNQLAETTDTGLNDVMRVAKALAAGDLSQKIEKDYPGVFGETGRSVNATVVALTAIVAEIEQLARAAGQGDFSIRADLNSKQGFARELGGHLNQLSDVTEEGLRDIMRVANTLAVGDLTQTIEKDYPGLFGETREGINATVANLSTLVNQIKEAVDAINTAAGEIASGNQDLSSRTEEQASSLEETASSMEQLSATVKNNTHSANESRAAASEATEIARRGGDTVRSSAKTMTEIASSSARIADIIGVIDGIAFQTNILALNAAVEAARAGEQGRGFAVVATEVRSLAQRSADAAKEIKTLISDSVAKVREGTAESERAGAQMQDVIQSIERLSGRIADISEASNEQASGIEQISLAVQQMDEVTQQNAALVEEAAAAAEALQDQSEQLAKAVAVFKVAGARAMLPAGVSMSTRPAGNRRPAVIGQVKKQASLPSPSASGSGGDEWSEF